MELIEIKQVSFKMEKEMIIILTNFIRLMRLMMKLIQKIKFHNLIKKIIRIKLKRKRILESNEKINEIK